MSQIIINTGNIANDGTGDPLRTAFNDVNNNFTQVFNAGPVGSNIAIANNTIQTTNTKRIAPRKSHTEAFPVNRSISKNKTAIPIKI